MCLFKLQEIRLVDRIKSGSTLSDFSHIGISVEKVLKYRIVLIYTNLGCPTFWEKRL